MSQNFLSVGRDLSACSGLIMMVISICMSVSATVSTAMERDEQTKTQHFSVVTKNSSFLIDKIQLLHELAAPSEAFSSLYEPSQLSINQSTC